MDRISTILILLLTCIAGCTKGYDPEPPAPRMVPAPTLSLQTLHALYRSEAVTIHEEMVVAGTVTTSDKAGNFYRTLCIEQEGYGLEILVGGESLHSRYPIGCRLHLRLRGLTLAHSRGVLQVGLKAPDYAYEELEYLAAQPLIDEHLYRGELLEEPRAKRFAIGELSTERCGTLVVVTGLRHEPLTEEEPTLEGYHRFVDRNGEALHLYVSPYARFASHPLPSGEVTLQGVLQHLVSGAHAGFVIKPRDENDISE